MYLVFHTFYLGCQKLKIQHNVEISNGLSKNHMAARFPNTPGGFSAGINSIPAVFTQQLHPIPRNPWHFRHPRPRADLWKPSMPTSSAHQQGPPAPGHV